MMERYCSNITNIESNDNTKITNIQSNDNTGVEINNDMVTKQTEGIQHSILGKIPKDICKSPDDHIVSDFKTESSYSSGSYGDLYSSMSEDPQKKQKLTEIGQLTKKTETLLRVMLNHSHTKHAIKVNITSEYLHVSLLLIVNTNSHSHF